MFFVAGIKMQSRVRLFTIFESLCSFPVTTYEDEIFKSMSQPVCWTGSAKATHLRPVNARECRHLGTACKISTSLNSSNFSDPIPYLMTFFSFVDHIRLLESVQLAFFSASIKPFNVTKVSQSHPRTFSDAPGATSVNHF